MGQSLSAPREPDHDTAIQANLLLCPACRGQLAIATDGLRCAGDHSFPIEAGVADLRLDRSQDTALDLETYDEQHLVTPAHSSNLWRSYGEALAKFQRAPADRVLEIGSGTGNLTFLLAEHGPFREIHCSDISMRFMERLHQRVTEQNSGREIHRYLFDANFLPFQDGSISAVMGNSILHHLMTFERTLEDARRVLTPGGVAIFGEPVLDFHALLGLAAGIVLRADELDGHPQLPLRTRQALGAVAARPVTKLRNLLERGPELANVEDKFVFPIDFMRQLARRCGYADFHVFQHSPITNLHATVLGRLQGELRSFGEDPAVLTRFVPVLRPFSEVYGAAMQPYLSQAFAFFVFTTPER
jgi:SAM-dependent methyltransferase